MSLSPSAKPWRRAQRGPQPLCAEPPAAAPRLAGQRGTPTAAFRPENTPSTARTARRELPHPPPPGPEVTQFPQKTPNPAGPPPGASSSRPQAGNPAAADLCRIAAPGPAPVPGPPPAPFPSHLSSVSVLACRDPVPAAPAAAATPGRPARPLTTPPPSPGGPAAAARSMAPGPARPCRLSPAPLGPRRRPRAVSGRRGLPTGLRGTGRAGSGPVWRGKEGEPRLPPPSHTHKHTQRQLNGGLRRLGSK